MDERLPVRLSQLGVEMSRGITVPIVWLLDRSEAAARDFEASMRLAHRGAMWRSVLSMKGAAKE